MASGPVSAFDGGNSEPDPESSDGSPNGAVRCIAILHCCDSGGGNTVAASEYFFGVVSAGKSVEIYSIAASLCIDDDIGMCAGMADMPPSSFQQLGWALKQGGYLCVCSEPDFPSSISWKRRIPELGWYIERDDRKEGP